MRIQNRELNQAGRKKSARENARSPNMLESETEKDGNPDSKKRPKFHGSSQDAISQDPTNNARIF